MTKTIQTKNAGNKPAKTRSLPPSTPSEASGSTNSSLDFVAFNRAFVLGVTRSGRIFVFKAEIPSALISGSSNRYASELPTAVASALREALAKAGSRTEPASGNVYSLTTKMALSAVFVAVK